MQAYKPKVERQIVNFYGSLAEKDRRRYAAVEVAKLRHGGKAYLARLFGCDPDTIAAGSRDVEDLPADAAAGRVRKRRSSWAIFIGRVERGPRAAYRLEITIFPVLPGAR